MSDSTHYDVIGVDPDASRDEIRAAYRSRVDELKSARERKGVSDSALTANLQITGSAVNGSDYQYLSPHKSL